MLWRPKNLINGGLRMETKELNQRQVGEWPKELTSGSLGRSQRSQSEAV